MRYSRSESSFSHALTRTKIATNNPKNSTIGTTTGRARLRHNARGSPTRTSITGRTTRTPSVSPIHHVVQLEARSAVDRAPSAHNAVTDRVALTKQKAGDKTRKRNRSRGLSSGAG